MSFEEENKTPEVQTDNIFEEISSGFEDDYNEKNPEEDLSPEIQKMDLIAKILLGSTIALAVIVVLMYSYIWFQNSESKNTFLPSMMCSIFSWDAQVDNSEGCSSVVALQKEYTNKLNKEKFDILKGVLDLIEDTYEVEDFMNSKEIIFLLDKTKNKSRPLEILEAFDNVKNWFFSIWKSEVECKNININKEEEITADCTVFSYDWQSDINGTSQSYAALFQKEFEESNDFTLLEKQRNFSSYPVIWDGPVSRKTELHLRLKYEWWDTINF